MVGKEEKSKGRARTTRLKENVWKREDGRMQCAHTAQLTYLLIRKYVPPPLTHQRMKASV